MRMRAILKEYNSDIHCDDGGWYLNNAMKSDIQMIKSMILKHMTESDQTRWRRVIIKQREEEWNLPTSWSAILMFPEHHLYRAWLPSRSCPDHGARHVQPSGYIHWTASHENWRRRISWWNQIRPSSPACSHP